MTHIYHQGTSLEKKALEDVSLQIEEGECVGIIGETGSGKTTLVQHFNGLLKPSYGRIWFEGMELGRGEPSWSDLRRRAGLVFQYPEHQLFEETVFADISFVLRQQKTLSAGEIEERVKTACTTVDLNYEKFRRRSPFELSGGEMRRVALAGVLIQEPHLLILDEPTVGLDGPGKREILQGVKELNHTGKTVVIVSHAVEDLLDLVTRLIVLEEGKVIVTGPPAEVFSFFLKTGKLNFLIPPVFQLFRDLQTSGWEVNQNIFQVEEALAVLDRILREESAGKFENPHLSS